jgi:hypothetical protein
MKEVTKVKHPTIQVSKICIFAGQMLTYEAIRLNNFTMGLLNKSLKQTSRKYAD